MTIILTLPEAKRLAAEVVAEVGEGFKYEPPAWADGGCMYVHRDKDDEPIPGCIAARILVKAGVPIDLLSAVEGNSAASLLSPQTPPYSAGGKALREAVVCDDQVTAMYVNTLQSLQDDYDTYGNALEEANDRY